MSAIGRRQVLGWLTASASCIGAPTIAATGRPNADAISDASGKIDAERYKALARRMDTADAITYRYGEPSSLTDAGLPQWWERPSNAMPVDAQSGGVPKGGRPVNKANAGTYQVGRWVEDVGGFSSNWGHVGFIPDRPAEHIGMADLLLTSISNAVLTQRPELPWMYYGRGIDAIALLEARSKDALKLVGPPVAMGRCHGRPGWGVTSILVFADGLVVNAGSNTQTNRAHCRLPSGKVPTAVAVTNSNEFALITCWDIEKVRGEVAVIALCALPEGDSLDRLSRKDSWGEWVEPYPGLPNLGNIAYMKLLGMVPLPETMKAPTEISATTGMDRTMYLSAGAEDSPRDFPLSVEANRLKFKPGAIYARAIPTRGQAVVISKSERRAVFIDLTPLIGYYGSMYFSTPERFQRTRSVGDRAGQWPHTFAEAPQQVPRVVKSVTLADRPTAVKCYAWGNLRQAWIATQQGKLLQFGIADGEAKGSIDVGANPTAIELAKEKAINAERIYPDYSRELIVTSRATRSVQWVRLRDSGGEVVRTLRDKRLRDPITACDTDNQGSELYVVSVVDWAGKAVRNYRFGALNLYPAYRAPRYGNGPTGDAEFEYGGGFDMPGRPFSLCSSNTS